MTFFKTARLNINFFITIQVSLLNVGHRNLCQRWEYNIINPLLLLLVAKKSGWVFLNERHMGEKHIYDITVPLIFDTTSKTNMLCFMRCVTTDNDFLILADLL